MTAASVPVSGRERWRQRLKRIPTHVVLIVMAIVWIVPTVGLLISSIRPRDDILTSGWWTVLSQPFNFTQYTLENYGTVIFDSGLGQAFLNSLTITIPGTIIPITVAAFAGYAFAWLEFRGKYVLFVVVVGLLVVPLQMTLIPILSLFNQLGLSGEFLGVWLAHAGYGLPFAVFLLTAFIAALPKDLFESAFIDGASHLTAFFRLVLPLSIPALAALAIFHFLWVWNDLLVALIYLGGTAEVAPLTVAVSNLVSSRGSDWELLTAAAFVSMLLPLIVFLAMQRHFVRGITAGAVKG